MPGKRLERQVQILPPPPLLPRSTPGGVVELAQTPSQAALTLRLSLQTEHVPPNIKSTVGVLHRRDCQFKSGPPRHTCGGGLIVRRDDRN